MERCIDEELPFEIPENWCWVRFGTAITLLSGTDFAPDEYNSAGKGIAYITGASNIVDSQIRVNRWTESPRQITHAGDIQKEDPRHLLDALSVTIHSRIIPHDVTNALYKTC